MNLEKKLVQWFINKNEKGEGTFRHPLQVSFQAACQLNLRNKFEEIHEILSRLYSGPTEPETLFDDYVADEKNYKVMKELIKDLVSQNLSENEITTMITYDLVSESLVDARALK
jgi:hypothetical protein